eukprot:13483971-Ditylum_brightwellii.AAC.1
MAPLYADYVALDWPAAQNAKLLRLLGVKGPDRGYFPEPEKSIHVCNHLKGGHGGEHAQWAL